MYLKFCSRDGQGRLEAASVTDEVGVQGPHLTSIDSSGVAPCPSWTGVGAVAPGWAPLMPSCPGGMGPPLCSHTASTDTTKVDLVTSGYWQKSWHFTRIHSSKSREGVGGNWSPGFHVAFADGPWVVGLATAEWGMRAPFGSLCSCLGRAVGCLLTGCRGWASRRFARSLLTRG